MEWISVNDRLPEMKGLYLVAANQYKDTTIAEYSALGKSWIGLQNVGTYDDWDYDCEVTHWMPLPEPPKKP